MAAIMFEIPFFDKVTLKLNASQFNIPDRRLNSTDIANPRR